MGVTAAGAGALALPGCAVSFSNRSTRPGCLPRVNVSEERVIRTVAGLRPYRRGGFVVRAETQADKRIVHNYGHGGAGITLSWGASKLATELGLPGHGGAVAVLGAGVMGLTTACLVQEAGFPVTLYAAALPPHTTSNIAGGQWSPFGHFREDQVTPEWRTQFARALDYSWRRFQIMLGPEYGVRWLTTYVEGARPTPEALAPYHIDERRLSEREHPFRIEHLSRYDTMYAEVGRLLRQLRRDVQLGGGKFEIRRFASREELNTLPEQLIFNCTGLGSRDLFGDTDLIPARGQLAVLVPQPEIRYAFSGQAGYMFPREDGIVLGGTFERDVWETTPEPEAIARIIADHQRVFEGFRCTA